MKTIELRLPLKRHEELDFLIARDGVRCVWCSNKMERSEMTVDHVRLNSRQGSRWVGNLVLACAACNHARANTPFTVWVQRCTRAGQRVRVGVVEQALERQNLPLCLKGEYGRTVRRHLRQDRRRRRRRRPRANQTTATARA